MVLDSEVHEYSTLSDLPRPLAVAMGRELGISPVVHLNPSLGSSTISVWDHLEVLSDAADLLGYAGATPAVLAEALLEHAPFGGPDCTLVALIPDPTSHRAAPPGLNWFLHAERFERAPGETMGHGGTGDPERAPYRVGVSEQRRNHHDPASRILLWDDLLVELARREAASLGLDSMLILNVEERVASVGFCAVMLQLGDRYVTPPLSEGAVDTPWRRHVLYSGEAVEMRLTLDNVRDADRVFCLSPWGEEYRLTLVESGDAGGDRGAERR